jgi:hypothetical protein
MLYLPVADVAALERDPDLGAIWMADHEPVDIGTAWHGLHFLLTGSAWGGSPPLRDAVLGGVPLGDPTSYEPVRFVSVDQVKAVAEALPPAEQLVPRFTHKAMRQAELYPDTAWDDPEALSGFLLPAYAELCDVFCQAAAARHALLIALERD